MFNNRRRELVTLCSDTPFASDVRSGTSIDWALEWNCHRMFQTNCDYYFAVLGKLTLADPSVLMQRFSVLSAYYFHPRRKVVYSVLKHYSCGNPCYITFPFLLFLYLFFDWIQSCLTVCIDLGFVTKVKWFSSIWQGRQILYYGITNIVRITVNMK